MELVAPMAARFRLDELLEESGLSQRELAARSGVSPTIVNRIVQNLAKQVALKTLDAIAAVLSQELGRRIGPGELIEGVPEKGKRGRG
jgi:transcriptional regulator with XRE-family HTH domain